MNLSLKQRTCVDFNERSTFQFIGVLNNCFINFSASNLGHHNGHEGVREPRSSVKLLETKAFDSLGFFNRSQN